MQGPYRVPRPDDDVPGTGTPPFPLRGRRLAVLLTGVALCYTLAGCAAKGVAPGALPRTKISRIPTRGAAAAARSMNEGTVTRYWAPAFRS